MKQLINDRWRFAEYPAETEEAVVLDTIKEKAEPVSLPHDWMIGKVKELYRSSVGVYFLSLSLDTGKANSLYFEGVYMRTTVFVNGQKAFFWPYGYTSFEVDLTPFQKEGENEVVVYVDYREPNTRWYSGAGIFRDVYLLTRNAAMLKTDGVYISAKEKKDGSFTLTIDAETGMNRKLLRKQLQEGCAPVKPGDVLTVKHSILKEGVCIQTVSEEVTVYLETNTVTSVLTIKEPRLWSLSDPFCYTCVTELFVGEEQIDVVENTFGLRTIAFTPEQGFLLNHEVVKLHGACSHHDLGALGSAFNESAAKRQLLSMKRMGINAIRTSHNPPAPAYLRLADTLGFLVIVEGFDMWEQSKTRNDYGVFFHDWCERDVESFVRRDRNHPCVIMWSLGNEIPDTNDPKGAKIAERLQKAARRNDYRHNAYTTIGSNFVAWEIAQLAQDKVEVSGYNYMEWVYEEHRRKYPDWCIYGSETSSTVQSRGIYHFPKSKRLLTYEDMQCSSLDNCSTNWGAKSVKKVITDDRDCGFCAGQFIWTGWDYIGEPTPYFSKNSFFGHIDTAGFWKDTAYLFKAVWQPVSDPFVHITPYWDFNEGEQVDVLVSTNGSFIKLFFNDELVAEKAVDVTKDKDFYLETRLPYHQGALRAESYDKEGRLIATDLVESFTDPVSVCLTAEEQERGADGENILFFRVGVQDEKGRLVKNARNRIDITVEGEGVLLGLDNGDSTDYEEYQTNSRKLFSGGLTVLVGTTKKAGKVTVKAVSEGLAPAEVTVVTEEAFARSGCGERKSVPVAEKNPTVPARKIALTADGATSLDKEHNTVTVKAEVFPKQATPQEISWRLMTDQGIESRAAELSGSGSEVVLTAREDGAFRLVASVTNKAANPEVMSTCEFAVTGFGKKSLNPYELIHGCQFTSSDKEALLSFRGGVNLASDNTSITFDELDFGEYGSDVLTVSLFTWRDEDPIEIWAGKPEESELLYKGMYRVPSIYNVFQENTFTLSRRLRGMSSVTFRFPRGLVLGGFYMEKQEKAYGVNYTADVNGLTGDSFDKQETGLYHIGNNVDLEFTGMNFTKGVSAIEITGRAHVAKNPVHVRFFGKDGEEKRVVEWTGNDEIETRTFPLTGFNGEGKVNFIFMPGSDFDFISFRFIPADESEA